MTTITSEIRPDSIESRADIEASTSWQTLIDCVNYDVPQSGYNATRQIADGYAEVSGRIVVCNKTGAAETVSIRILKADDSTRALAQNYQVAANDTAVFEFAGLYLLNRSGTDGGQGDRLQVLAGAGSALDVIVSYVAGIAESAV